MAWLHITTFCLLGLWAGSAPGQSPAEKGAIAGKVVDPAEVEIAGVHVTVVEELLQRSYEATTDCSGSFLFSGLEPGRYTIKFESAGFRTETRSGLKIASNQAVYLYATPRIAQISDGGPRPVVKIGMGPIDEAFALPTGATAPAPEKGRLEGASEIQGTVFDPSGAILAGTLVRAVNEISGEQYASKSGADGSYRFSRLPAGSYLVSVRNSNFRCQTQEVTVNKAGRSTAVFRLLERLTNPAIFNNPACAPLIETEAPAKPATGIALEAEAELRSTTANALEIWTTVKLKNISGHRILIPAGGSRTPGFAVELMEVYGSDRCDWPSRLRDFYVEAMSADGRRLRVKHGRLQLEAGQVVTGRFEMSKLFDLNRTNYYVVEIWRHDTSETKDGLEREGQPLARSNWITIESESN